MKKIFLIFLLASLSFTCFAEVNRTIDLNAPNCQGTLKNNLIVCFQNKTYDSLSKYNLLEDKLYQDGTSESTIYNLAALQFNNFSVISNSTTEFRKNRVVSQSYSVIKGDASKYRLMAGCTTKLTPTSISKSVLEIYTNRYGEIFCK